MLPTFLVSLLITYLPLPLRLFEAAWPWNIAGVISIVLVNFCIWRAGAAITIGRIEKGNAIRAGRALRGFKTLKFAVVLFTFLCINLFQWHALAERVVPEELFIPLISDIILLLPLLVMVTNAMASERRVVEASGGSDAGDCGTPGLLSHLLLRFRMELGIILLPWLLLTLASDTVVHFFPHHPFAHQWVALGLAATLVMFGPLFLRFLWPTSPLPPGPLRRRLYGFGDEVKFKFSNIFLWRTQMQIPNAAVIGIMGFLRYVFVTDVLIAHCSDEEVESVFAHEAGHIKHHHFLYYFLLIIIFGSSLAVVTGVASRIGAMGGEAFPAFAMTEIAGPALILLYILFYWAFFFGYVSRRFEREADLFSVSNISRPQAFLSALEKIAALSGRNRGQGGWRHFSIARRTCFLREAAASEATLQRAQRTAGGLKVLIAALAAVSGGLVVLL